MGKFRFLILVFLVTLLTGGCGSRVQESRAEATASDRDVGNSAADGFELYLDDTVYIGEYLDSDAGEPNLEIAKGDDGKYIVQIGIYRLTSLSDGVGEQTAEGMEFTATDAAGNPIRGIITVQDHTAIVTFTDSTWEGLPEGSSFQYTKASDVPNIGE